MSARDASARARLAAKIAAQKSEACPEDEDLFMARIEAERTLELANKAVLSQRRGGDLELLAAERRERHATHAILNSAFARSKGTSKALPGQYVTQQDVADNPAARAIVHHTSSHYHMAGSKQYQLGNRVKGTVSRRSRQGMRNGAAKQLAAGGGKAAQEAARGQRAAGAGRKKMKSSKKKKGKGGDD